MKYFGSVLSISDISPQNAHSWGVDLTKKSFLSKVINLVGVPHIGARIRNRMVLDILKSKKEIGTIIDIGGGIGLTGFYLNQFGYKYLCIDQSKYKIKIAHKLLRESRLKNVNFLLGDIYAKLRVKGKFDCALSMEVLEHVEKPAEMIARMAKFIKPNGVIILSFPSIHHINSLSQGYFGHVRVGYSPRDIKKFASELNLKVERVESFGNSLFCKAGFYVDYFLIKYVPMLSGVFFWVFYPIVVFDQEFFKSNNPIGYVIVLEK